MRKLFAFAMVALLSLTIALAAVGCGQKTETSTTESTPPAENTMPADTGAMADTGMSHMGMDTTVHQ